MGLLDFMNTPEGQSLLAGVASYAVNARRGTPINNLGAGGMGALMGYNNAIDAAHKQQQQAFDNQLNTFKMQQLKRQMEQEQQRQDQLQQFRQKLPGMLGQVTPGLSDQQAAGMMDEAATFGTEGIKDAMTYANQPNPLAQQLSILPDEQLGKAMDNISSSLIEQAFPKPSEPYTLTPGSQRFGPDNKPVASVPVKPETSPLAQLLQERAALPEGSPFASVYDQAIKKATTHQPATTLNNYGTNLVPVVDANNNVGMAQPGKDGQVKIHTGIIPLSVAEENTQAKTSAASSMATLDRFRADANEVLNNPGLKYAVGLYSAAPLVPGTEQANAITAVDNLASKAAVQAINEMRAMSKTGGAVGQVTEKEWPKLEAQIANLNRKQSLDQFKKNLQKLINQIDNSKRLISEAHARMPKATGQASESGNPEKRGMTNSRAYQEYVDAYNKATTQAQRDAINARARSMGVIK